LRVPQGRYAGDICRLQGSLHRDSQQRLANTSALPTAINGESREQHDGYPMLCQALL